MMALTLGFLLEVGIQFGIRSVLSGRHVRPLVLGMHQVVLSHSCWWTVWVVIVE